jgi:hypothetical protein
VSWLHCAKHCLIAFYHVTKPKPNIPKQRPDTFLAQGHSSFSDYIFLLLILKTILKTETCPDPISHNSVDIESLFPEPQQEFSSQKSNTSSPARNKNPRNHSSQEFNRNKNKVELERMRVSQCRKVRQARIRESFQLSEHS